MEEEEEEEEEEGEVEEEEEEGDEEGEEGAEEEVDEEEEDKEEEEEDEVAFFSAKCWDRRNRADLIESVTPCHDAQVVGPYRDSNPLRLTILAAMSEDYTTAPQHLQEEEEEKEKKKRK